MEFGFEARVLLKLAYKEGAKTSKHVATKFYLETFGPVDRKMYIEDELPTKDGSFALSNVLVQGLIGNIHLAHERGWRDSAEHLRWIIAQLEQGFAAVCDVEESTYDK